MEFLDFKGLRYFYENLPDPNIAGRLILTADDGSVVCLKVFGEYELIGGMDSYAYYDIGLEYYPYEYTELSELTEDQIKEIELIGHFDEV